MAYNTEEHDMTGPTPDEVKSSRAKAGLTQSQAARLVLGTLRAWQDWEGGQRRMGAATWLLWGIITCEQWALDALRSARASLGARKRKDQGKPKRTEGATPPIGTLSPGVPLESRQGPTD